MSVARTAASWPFISMVPPSVQPAVPLRQNERIEVPVLPPRLDHVEMTDIQEGFEAALSVQAGYHVALGGMLRRRQQADVVVGEAGGSQLIRHILGRRARTMRVR